MYGPAREPSGKITGRFHFLGSQGTDDAALAQHLQQVSLAISSSFLTASPWTFVSPVMPRIFMNPARRRSSAMMLSDQADVRQEVGQSRMLRPEMSRGSY